LKLLAYGTLANLWINLGSREPIAEEEAKAFLGVQDAVIQEFDKTLQAYLDEASIKAFRDYVEKHKVCIA
jgi:hypothetical protein